MKYILSEIFTLIPAELYTPQMGEIAITAQFSPGKGYNFRSYALEKINAVVAYAVKEQIAEGETESTSLYPLIVRLIEESNSIESYNKVIFHYCNQRNIAHIVICLGDELKLANSFKADSFESALYFLFLSIKQQQMNPKQCVVRVCSTISTEQEETVRRFFNGVEHNNLDNIIVK